MCVSVHMRVCVCSAHHAELLRHFTPESNKVQGGGWRGVPDVDSVGTEEEQLRGIWTTRKL